MCYSIYIFEHDTQNHKMLGKLTKRMELVTGLEIPIHHAHDPYITAASQAWQMGVYGPGGHFWPHYDGFEKVGPVFC